MLIMDRYQRIKLLGEGSFGKAFLVQDKTSNKQYVVKEINMSRMGAKEREDARKEVAVLAQLQHPNIVSYKESFEEIGNLYISMDYCDAGDLFAKINAQRGVLMAETQVLDMFVQICLAMKHIHDRKILHRDIKSQNIFITQGGIMKLGDFGIAKIMNSTVELARTCIGTPYYLSPEICENRPYNNKSDIWSLGCVLYEMTTLKHPFEAGSMKNLVLKIIRGVYPPVPPRYSYELRNLQAQLFKRNPRDRPSINNILKKPFIQERIKKFLNESEVQSEFSHTVLHGAKLQKRLPPGGRPVSAPVAKKPIPAPQRYDPASVYKNKVAARRPLSAANRAAPASRQQNSGPGSRPPSAGGNRPPSVGGNRPPSAGGSRPPSSVGAAQRNNDMVARRRELVEKERQRKADVAAKRADELKIQHQKLIEKQKQDRISKGREQWRNNLLDFYGENNDENVKKDEVSSSVSAGAAPKGNYARYHEILEQQCKERDDKLRHIAAGGDNPISAAHKAAVLGQENRQQGAVSADRARMVEEFKERQRQAMLNKAKGQADIGAAARPFSRPPSGRERVGAVNPPPSARNAEEADYLQRLKQIRLQNFNERRALRDRQAGRLDAKEAERQRNIKIEALKAQAEERGRRLKNQLERHRKEALAREMKQQANRAVPAARPVSSASADEREPSGRAVPICPPSAPAKNGRAVPVKPMPAPGLTNALNAIGVASDVKSPAAAKGPSMTNVMSDIGVPAGQSQQQPPLNKERPKWGKPAASPLADPADKSDRARWGLGAQEKVDLSNMALESTASQMETTSAPPQAENKTPWGKPTILKPADGNRPAWKAPSSTVVNALQAAEIDSSTVTISPHQASEAVKLANQKIGETISVSKPLVLKKPTILSAKPTKPLTGATITISRDEPDLTLKKDEQTSKNSDAGAGEPSVSSSLADTSVPLFNKQPLPSAAAAKMVADSDLDIVDLDLNEREKNLLGSLERAQQPFLKKTSGLMIGLTTGHFDCNEKLLRTCSEPDLAKLTRASDNPFMNMAASAIFDDSSNEDTDVEMDLDLKEREKDTEAEANVEDGSDQSVVKQEMEIDDDVINEDDDEDKTLYEAELVALMASQGSDSTQESESKTPQFDLISPTSGEEEETEEDILSDEESAEDQQLQDAVDFEKLRETLQQVLVQDDVKKTSTKKMSTAADAVSSIQKDLSKVVISESESGKEEWVSDDSSDGDHASPREEEEDMFCRLEESRANLEKELGEVTFRKAYKLMQAIHEDEEESIEEGSKLVTKVLGEQKSHLYDKILHLVVADSAYLDDNC